MSSSSRWEGVNQFLILHSSNDPFIEHSHFFLVAITLLGSHIQIVVHHLKLFIIHKKVICFRLRDSRKYLMFGFVCYSSFFVLIDFVYSLWILKRGSNHLKINEKKIIEHFFGYEQNVFLTSMLSHWKRVKLNFLSKVLIRKKSIKQNSK